MGGNKMTKKVTTTKEYHHIIAMVRETSDGMKHICTSICYAPIIKGTEIISDDDGTLKVARCTDISICSITFLMALCMLRMQWDYL